MAFPLSTLDTKCLAAVRANCDARLATMRGYRLSWWTHWSYLAEMFLPRRYRWLVTPNNFARGNPINGAIVDETGVLAARTLATGMLANLTSPTQPWFRLTIDGLDPTSEEPAQVWLAECTRRMLTVYAESNFYQAMGTANHDNVVFGSAAMVQEEDDKDIIRFYNYCLGEFFFGLDNRQVVDTLYTEFTYTVDQTVKEFGIESVSASTSGLYRTGGAAKDNEVVICCAIEPNDVVYFSDASCGTLLPSRFKYRKIYWEKDSAQGTDRQSILSVDGYREKAHVGLRWDVTSNDAYGRSPGMDALPCVRQLQLEQRRKAEAIDKLVRPPMVGSIGMKNEPMDIMPGGVTFTADPAANGFKPAFQVEPRIQEMMLDIQENQTRCRSIFFNDLFTRAIEENKVQTATYWEVVQSEKLVLLGPVVERVENEGLDDILFRTFSIMQRRGLFPEPPPEIAGTPLRIQYISILAEAQRASSVAAIERVLALAGNLVAVSPQAMDNINIDESIDLITDMLNAPPTMLNDSKTKAAIRDARSQQERAAAALQTGAVAAQGAQTLSQTTVGAGNSALDLMLNQ